MKTVRLEDIPPDARAREFLESLDLSREELVVEQNGEPKVVLSSAVDFRQRQRAKKELFRLVDRIQQRHPQGDSDELLAALATISHTTNHVAEP